MSSNSTICFYAAAIAPSFRAFSITVHIRFTFNSQLVRIESVVLYLSAGRIRPSSLPLLFGHHQENCEPHNSYDQHQGHHTTHDDGQVYVTGEGFLHHRKCLLVLSHDAPDIRNLII